MKKQTAQLRCENLSEMTGLTVTSYSRNNVEYFQFIGRLKDGRHRTIITTPTYRKARCFAQGFQYGKEHERLLYEQPSLLSLLRAAIQAIRRALWSSS